MRRAGHTLATGVLLAWSAAMLEGLLLQFAGSGRSAADWGHALLLYGWFGIAVATGVALLAWPLPRTRPGSIDVVLFPGVFLLLSVVVGGMWLNLWSAMPPSCWSTPCVGTTSAATGTRSRPAPTSTPGQRTLAESFHRGGYRTGAFVANPILRPASGFTRGFEVYEPTPPPRWVQGRTTAFEFAAARLREGRDMVGMPLILELPAPRSVVGRSDLPVDMVDLAATLATLAGLEPGWHGEGEDHGAAILDGDLSSGTRAGFVELPGHLYGLRVGDWKLIRRVREAGQIDRLFDLVTDPAESSDLSATHPDTLLSLQLRLRAVLDAMGEVHRARGAGQIDPRTLRALRTLGYTN